MSIILPVRCCLLVCLLGMYRLCGAALPSPFLSFSAGYATYLIGEPVYLQCLANSTLTVHGYRFFKNNQEVQSTMGSFGNQFTINMVNTDHAGSYTCIYWVSDSRGLQTSSHSPPVTLSVLDQPSTPVLLIKPKHLLYFVGESVTLVCDHPHVNSQLVYSFQKDGTELPHRDLLQSELRFSHLSTKDSGAYDCQYWLTGHPRRIISSRSVSQKLYVTDLSASPVLNFQPPYSTFILGENLTLECVAPSPVPVTLFRLYKEGREMIGSPNPHSGRHTLYNVTKEDQGEYTSPLLPPLLSLDPPNGRIWDGGNVTLFCTILSHFERTTFHFLTEKEEILSVSTNKTETRKSITITVRKSNATAAKYFCQYTVEINGRLLLSPKSSQAEITVITGSVFWLIAAGVVAGIVVLFIMILLLYWVLRSRIDQTESAPKTPEVSSEDSGKFISSRSQDKC
ncbi:uncharacterized protein LOC128498515 isoform X2 [Spea bombifrons]|uniref:uncharacterized protein LOC128498515 isoform X2 n=1 Tax=Spea bombifrons TaxID=233779 RepID=UPI00234A1057|nr:uncharacterized protein LOC128498515 isoform X2 [Spea bombifrons]